VRAQISLARRGWRGAAGAARLARGGRRGAPGHVIARIPDWRASWHYRRRMDPREAASSPAPLAPPPLSPQSILALVQTSPELVFAHDREGWLGLFSQDAYIEDPMGSPPAPKSDGTLGRFWDTFIADSEIVFEVRRDLVSGHDVFRDVVIHTKIGASVRVDVEAYLLYQVDAAGKSAVRMAAHWDLTQMSLLAMKLGPSAWVEMTKLFARMFKVMGPAWVGGYLASMWNGIGGRGVRLLGHLGDAIAARDVSGIVDLFVDDAAPIELGSRRATPRTLLSLLPEGSRLAIERPISAGWTTSFRFRIDGPSPIDGLGLFEFAPGSARIVRARLFAD
jgi:hypothetical protein